MLRLRWSQASGEMPASWSLLNERMPRELLTIADAVLQLHPGWQWKSGPRDRFAQMVVEIESILIDGSSLYTVDPDRQCLTRRVDATTRAAASRAIASAPEQAADHLAAAWVAAYGLNPDPDKAFNEAIRAVEEVACPLVQPKLAQTNKPTLGTVLGELGKNAPHRWELALPDVNGAPAGPGSLVAVMNALWEAQVSRHGGSAKSRRQDVQEAESAVHLAVLAVQWLSTGVLRKKP